MNIQTERQLLSILISFTDPVFAKQSIFKLTQKGLKSEFFAYSGHRNIFDAILQLASQDTPINIIEIVGYIKSELKQDTSKYMNILGDIATEKHNVHDLMSLLNSLKETYFREQIKLMSERMTAIASNQILDVDTAITECQAEISKLIKQTTVQQSDSDDLGVIMENYLATLLSDVSTPVYDTGLIDFDDIIQFVPKTLNILAGRPSMGKTAFALYLLFSIMVRHKKPCYLFSLEMAKDQLVERFLTMGSHYTGWSEYELKQVDSWRLNQHKLSKLPSKKNDPDSHPLSESEISNLHLINEIFNYHQTENSLIGICDDRMITPTQIEMKCVEFMQKKKVDSLGLVVIDYVQEMAKGTSTNSGQRSNEIGTICRQIRDISSRINTPILLLAQLNRDVENRNDKRPNMADLADSGAIEQSADTIMMMYRDGYYNPDSFDKAIAEVLIKKNRVTGVTGTTKLLFHPHECVFKNLAI
jgi:replicative DNA helicase